MTKIFSCFGILVFLFLVGLIMLALFGVKIPYLSPILFKEPPKLERLVASSPDRGKEQLAKMASSQSLILDDSDFSSILAAGFINKSDYIKSVKANIYPSNIKVLIVFGKVDNYYLLMTLVPNGNSGKFKITKAQIGHLPLPIFVANWILGNRGQIDLSTLFKSYGLSVENIILSDREIEIFFIKN